MKNKVIVTACTLLAMATASAQNAYDAEKLLGNDLNGTARFVGMGGAMGALGGDISVMSSNPAGIGIFRSNDVSVSFGFNNTSTKSNFSGVSMNEDKTRASFDQIGFVYSNKIGNNTSLRFVNFGFNYHKSKNFNRLFSMGGALDNLSQSFQLAQEMERYGLTESEFNDILDVKNPYTKYWNQLPVLGVMGVRTGVVDWFNDPEKNIHAPWGWNGFNNNFFSKETGGISQYDFNVSFNIEDRVYLGATLGVYDVNYDRYTSYTENLNDDKGADNGGYTLDNYYRLEGTGLDLKLGVIVRPIESSPFRLGFAVHTPTWYDLRESYNATLSSDILAYEKPYIQTLSDFLVTPEYDYLTYDYNLTTPWKFNVSAGTTFAGAVAVGAEYEYQDYSSSKLKDVDGYELGDQPSVENYLKGVHTFRIGMETRIIPEFSIRAGYNYSSAAFSKDAYSALSLYSTRTDFNNTESKNTFTFGLGYRGSVIYADLAYKYDMYKSNFYAFDDNIDLPATKVDNERHQLLLTVGARF